MLACALAFVVTHNYNGYARQQRSLPVSATAVGHDPVGAGQRVSRLLWTSSMTSYLPADGQVLGLGASSADAAFELNCVSGGRESERGRGQVTRAQADTTCFFNLHGGR